MNPDELREYLLAKPAVIEETPFGPDVLVYKVKGKGFATLGFEIEDGMEVGRTNLKCDPDRAVELRADHDAIVPGYHMNKRHWNTLVLDGSLTPKLVRELCDHSYALVVAKLPKRDREGLV
ncbi:MmcQ/YjbR family DNA-binding protein [Verrucomicrobiales bacterium]|nr:MmcQ/YjbR family DNA-binding protein [Verrucomicrobiales bacterium]MDF1789911.1 MmcQ/YjbR family DNA-binding protein [Verrucomicrobiales bacterium]